RTRAPARRAAEGDLMADKVQPSRPDISVGGQAMPSLADALLDLRVEETVDGLYHCELTVGNWGPVEQRSDFLYFDRKKLDFGKEVVIALAGETLFKGKITALEAHFPEGRAPTLTVLAEDRFQDLRMTRRTRTFADTTDAALMQQIASDHGLTP